MATPLGTAAHGVVLLQEVTPNSPTTRALLARDQNHLGRGNVVMRPRNTVRVPKGNDEAKATQDNSEAVDPATIGLGMKPVMIQRGEDAAAVPLQLDGMSSTMTRFSADAQAGRVSGVVGDAPQAPAAEEPPAQEPAKVETPEAPVTRRRGAKQAAKPVAVTPKRRRVRLQGPNIGRVTVFCDDVSISEKVVVLCFAGDGSVAIVEPPKAEGLTVEIDGGAPLDCVAPDISFDTMGQTMVVLLRVPASG